MAAQGTGAAGKSRPGQGTRAKATAEALLEINVAGFAQVLAQKGLSRILVEPVANALDTDAQLVTVTVDRSRAGRYRLVVTDDDPQGFERLSDVWTVFAPSTRKDNPLKRGRFGAGDKEVVAAVALKGSVRVHTTKGTVVFDRSGRRVNRSSKSTVGTTLEAEFPATRGEIAEFERLMEALIVPLGVELRYESFGHVIEAPPRKELFSFEAVLPTVTADKLTGALTGTKRKTTVTAYEPRDGETPKLFELGIPVVDIDVPFLLDVAQKIPLNKERDNVTPAYRRQIHLLALDHGHAFVDEEAAKEGWVQDQLEHATDEAFDDIVHKIVGANAVVVDPSDPEATKRARDEGFEVVHGRQFKRGVYDRLSGAGIVPAGRQFPSGIPVDEEGKPPIPEDDWTGDMKLLAEYARTVGVHLLGFEPKVEYADIPRFRGNYADALAWFGGGTVTLNLGRLGKTWPTRVVQEDLDALLIHEFAHRYASDHLSDAFHTACCMLGAKLRTCKAQLR